MPFDALLVIVKPPEKKVDEEGLNQTRNDFVCNESMRIGNSIESKTYAALSDTIEEMDSCCAPRFSIVKYQELELPTNYGVERLPDNSLSTDDC